MEKQPAPYVAFAIFLMRDGREEFLAIQRAPTAKHARARYAIKAKIADSQPLVSDLVIRTATPEDLKKACTHCGRNTDLRGAKPCPKCPSAQPRPASK